MDQEEAYEHYIALPPMFRALGMDWRGQRKKLANHPTLSRHTLGRRVMTASGTSMPASASARVQARSETSSSSV